MLFQVLYYDNELGRWFDFIGQALTADEIAMNLQDWIEEVGAVKIVNV